jgi:hypothetical protein
MTAQIVGNVGMYYVAYRLSALDWNVMPTSRNARGIDLLAYDSSAAHFLGIQVKTLSEHGAIALGTKRRLVGNREQGYDGAGMLYASSIGTDQARRPRCGWFASILVAREVISDK